MHHSHIGHTIGVILGVIASWGGLLLVLRKYARKEELEDSTSGTQHKNTDS